MQDNNFYYSSSDVVEKAFKIEKKRFGSGKTNQ